MKICITGSLGLVGLSASKHFLAKGNTVVGVDNDMRKFFFGDEGSTKNNLSELTKSENYYHENIDIRDVNKINELFSEKHFDVIIHCAAQPSHDKAKEIPLIDFEVNAGGTLNLLEATRQYCPEATFIYTSTNKVYGDYPNRIDLKESDKRYDFSDANFKGFDETTPIDNSLHSLFGVSKTVADLYVQEYGKYFNMNTVAFRLGCITGSHHAGVKLHGFLSYLIKSLARNRAYEIIGYKGKQVRDQIHADDLIGAMEEVIAQPVKGEVFNLGGGRQNNASILELIEIIEAKLNIKTNVSYKNEARMGDHICYITDFSKFQRYYPNWSLKRDLDSIVEEIIEHEG